MSIYPTTGATPIRDAAPSSNPTPTPNFNPTPNPTPNFNERASARDAQGAENRAINERLSYLEAKVDRLHQIEKTVQGVLSCLLNEKDGMLSLLKARVDDASAQIATLREADIQSALAGLELCDAVEALTEQVEELGEQVATKPHIVNNAIHVTDPRKDGVGEAPNFDEPEEALNIECPDLGDDTDFNRFQRLCDAFIEETFRAGDAGLISDRLEDALVRFFGQDLLPTDLDLLPRPGNIACSVFASDPAQEVEISLANETDVAEVLIALFVRYADDSGLRAYARELIVDAAF